MKTCARERCPPTAVLKAMLAKGSVKFGLGMQLGRMEGAKEVRTYIYIKKGAKNVRIYIYIYTKKGAKEVCTRPLATLHCTPLALHPGPSPMHPLAARPGWRRSGGWVEAGLYILSMRDWQV